MWHIQQRLLDLVKLVWVPRRFTGFRAPDRGPFSQGEIVEVLFVEMPQDRRCRHEPGLRGDLFGLGRSDHPRRRVLSVLRERTHSGHPREDRRRRGARSGQSGVGARQGSFPGAARRKRWRELDLGDLIVIGMESKYGHR